MTKYYALVTFGQSNERKVHRDLQSAKKAAIASKGKLNCSSASVYECETRKLAETADISCLRHGERPVFTA